MIDEATSTKLTCRRTHLFNTVPNTHKMHVMVTGPVWYMAHPVTGL